MLPRTGRWQCSAEPPPGVNGTDHASIVYANGALGTDQPWTTSVYVSSAGSTSSINSSVPPLVLAGDDSRRWNPPGRGRCHPGRESRARSGGTPNRPPGPRRYPHRRQGRGRRRRSDSSGRDPGRWSRRARSRVRDHAEPPYSCPRSRRARRSWRYRRCPCRPLRRAHRTERRLPRSGSLLCNPCPSTPSSQSATRRRVRWRC